MAIGEVAAGPARSAAWPWSPAEIDSTVQRHPGSEARHVQAALHGTLPNGNRQATWTSALTGRSTCVAYVIMSHTPAML
jgi:hypothetical protein